MRKFMFDLILALNFLKTDKNELNLRYYVRIKINKIRKSLNKI